MSEKNDPAFPCGDMEKYSPYFGLSKREFFAAMAMQGLCTNDSMTDYPGDEKLISKASVFIADALIKELEGVDVKR